MREASLISSVKGGKMGIITLFHAVFQAWHINPHIRHRHINIHRCVYVHTLWLSGEQLLFHKPGLARSDRLCITFFRTLFFLLITSPLLSLLSAAHPITASSLVFISVSNLPRHLFSYFLLFPFFFLFDSFSCFCHVICFFPFFLFSAYILFYGPCHGSLIISAS